MVRTRRTVQSGANHENRRSHDRYNAAHRNRPGRTLFVSNWRRAELTGQKMCRGRSIGPDGPARGAPAALHFKIGSCPVNADGRISSGAQPSTRTSRAWDVLARHTCISCSRANLSELREREMISRGLIGPSSDFRVLCSLSSPIALRCGGQRRSVRSIRKPPLARDGDAPSLCEKIIFSC